MLELTDLTYKRDEYVDTLSRGMKQRLCLAKTLVHDPEVLLLDEPASGLDPRARIEIRELLQELCRMRKTILITSHILPELAELCNKVAIIEAGKLVMAGSVAEISAELEGRRQARHPSPGRNHEECCDVPPGAARRSSGRAWSTARSRPSTAGSPAEQHLLLAALVQAGFQVQSFTEQEMDLETLYMRVTKGIVS